MAKSKISAVHVALGVGALGALYLLTRKSAEKSAAEQHADAILAGQNRTGGWPGYSVIGADPLFVDQITINGKEAEAWAHQKELVVASKLRAAGYPAFAQRLMVQPRSTLPLVNGSRNLPLASWLKKALILLGLWDGDTSENWNNTSLPHPISSTLSQSGPTLLQTLAALQRSQYLKTKFGQPFAWNGHFDASVLDAVVGRLNEKGYLSLVPLPIDQTDPAWYLNRVVDRG